MMMRSLAAVSAVAWVGCATPQDPKSARPSLWDHHVAVYQAALAYRDAAASLRAAEAAFAASESGKSRVALENAKARLGQPNMALNPMWPELQKRAESLQALLNGAAPPVTASAPESVATPGDVATPRPDALNDAIARMTQTRVGLHGHELAQQDVEAAEAARDALTQALEDGQSISDKDDAYAARSQAGETLLSDVAEDIRLAHLIADFVAGPGAAQKKGVELSQKATEERDAKRRQRALREAREAFQDCVQDSRKMISEAPVLNRTALFLATSRTSPRKVAAACAQQQKAVAKKIASR
jgi:hypothetical protein